MKYYGVIVLRFDADDNYETRVKKLLDYTSFHRNVSLGTNFDESHAAFFDRCCESWADVCTNFVKEPGYVWDTNTKVAEFVSEINIAGKYAFTICVHIAA